MTSTLAPLTPSEAAYIACNAYFSLEGWDKRYHDQKNEAHKVTAATASKKIMNKEIVGSGSKSLNKTKIKGSINKALEAKTGSRLTNTRSGFGYMLSFERGGKKHLIIATRGTRLEMGKADLITDLNISPLRGFPGVGPVHAGFFDTFNSIKNQLDESLIKAADYVHCVGHSLGGAVANLVALQVSRITGKQNVGLYTFGAPRVGLEVALYSKVACGKLNGENVFRIGHDMDPVTMMCLPPFQHIHPSLNHKHNFILRSPSDSIRDLTNHDTGEYILSVKDKDWGALDAASMTSLEVDKQFFTQWMNDDTWIKRKLGMMGNAALGLLIKIIKGMFSRIAMITGMGIASVFDLVAIAIQKGTQVLGYAAKIAVKLINEIAKVFGIATKESTSFLMALFEKMKLHLQVMVKRAVKMASKVKNSYEFNAILSSASRIGLTLI